MAALCIWRLPALSLFDPERGDAGALMAYSADGKRVTLKEKEELARELGYSASSEELERELGIVHLTRSWHASWVGTRVR